MEIRADFFFFFFLKPLRLVVHASEGGEENNLFNIHEKKNTETNIGSANIKLLLLYRLVKKYIIF